MLCRLTYALERLHDASCLPGANLSGLRDAGVFHLSTPDHLALLLEALLTASPEARVRVFTHAGGLDPEGEVEAFARRLGVEIVCARPDTLLPPEGSADLAIQLFSMAVRPAPQEARRIRKAFAAIRAGRKIIVHGHNGSVWDGRPAARALRLGLRPLLERLRPRRDAAEQRRLARRLRPDPGYDPSRPPDPADPAFSSGGRQLLLTAPLRVEQCLATGNVLKPGLLAAPPEEEELYEGHYHFADLYDQRRDWDALLACYQRCRWRNMVRVGVTSAEEAPGATGRRPTALDIGCGTGGLAALLAARGYAVTGVDVSRTSIAKARSTFPDVEFKVVPFDALESLGARYDLITLSHVVEHARDDAALLRAAARLLAPGGRLYVEVPWLDPEPLQARPHWYRQRDHFREYTKLGLYLLVAGAGLRVLAHADSWHGVTEDREPYQFLLATRE